MDALIAAVLALVELAIWQSGITTDLISHLPDSVPHGWLGIARCLGPYAVVATIDALLTRIGKKMTSPGDTVAATVPVSNGEPS